jgi:hypothetical protein
MIYDGQTIILTIDYTGKEIIQKDIFAIERANLLDYISESYQRIAIGSLVFFTFFFLLGNTIVLSILLAIAASIVITVFLPVALFYFWLKLTNYLTDLYEKKGNKPTTTSITFHFDDDGFSRVLNSTRIKFETIKYTWMETVEAVENEKGIFISPSKISACFIPKRVFADSEELNQLKAFLISKLGERAKF